MNRIFSVQLRYVQTKLTNNSKLITNNLFVYNKIKGIEIIRNINNKLLDINSKKLSQIHNDLLIVHRSKHFSQLTIN